MVSILHYIYRTLVIWRRPIRFVALAMFGCVLTLFLSLSHPWAIVHAVDSAQTESSISSPLTSDRLQEEKLHQGIERFQMEDYTGAIAIWQTALDLPASSDDRLTQALLLSNLSLAYQHLLQWDMAQDYMTQSLAIFAQQEDGSRSSVEWDYYAKTLNTLGWLHWRQGYSQKALEVWEYTTQAYGAAGNTSGIIGSWINQAKVLQALGLSSQARKKLDEVKMFLDGEANSSLKVTGLRHLGNALRRVGELDKAEKIFGESLMILAALDSDSYPPSLASDLSLDIGNTYRSQWERAIALTLTDEIDQYRQLAQNAYEEAIATADSTIQKVLTETNLLSWLVVQHHQDTSDAGLSQRIAEMQTELALKFRMLESKPNRVVVGLRLQAADSWMAFNKTRGASEQAIAWNELIAELKDIAAQAEELGDRRSQALALGYTGMIFERMAQFQSLPVAADMWRDAQQLTRNAIALSEAIQATDIQYRLEWQLGQMLQQTNAGRKICIQEEDPKAENDQDDVLCAYEQAVNSLEKARKDLLSINPDVQFSFRDNVEPLYREYVALLLQSSQSDSPQVENKKLAKATQLIDALQLAELENFLGCNLDPIPLTDQVVDPHSAIIYPVILPESLDVVLSLPDSTSPSDSDTPQPQIFSHISTPITSEELATLLNQFRQDLADPTSNRQRRTTNEKKLYQLLIQPFEATLIDRQDIENLVFVLDGDLRTIPMASLKDSGRPSRYLVDKYAIAIAPSLQLVEPKPLRSPINVLAAGSSQAMDHPLQDGQFTPLVNVENELTTIEQLLPTYLLLNNEFTEKNLRQQLQLRDFSILHLATHGTFSSEPSRTFIAIHNDDEERDNGASNVPQTTVSSEVAMRNTLTTGVSAIESSPDQLSAQPDEQEATDTALFAKDLDVLLRDRPSISPYGNQELDLLVLSACETAAGDNRATLGIAGLSIQAGALSTLATLWSVYDDAAATLMQEFYQQLTQNLDNKESPVSRAQALRNAQLNLRQKHPEWDHPSYWAPYILVGSWL